LDDKIVDNIAKKFSIGSTHKGRVVGLDYFGNIVHFSFQKSVLDVKYFTYEDIEVGSIIKVYIYIYIFFFFFFFYFSIFTYL